MTEPTDTTDETQPHPTPPADAPNLSPSSPSSPPLSPSSPPSSPSSPPLSPSSPPLSPSSPPLSPALRADPDRPAASDWREPPWFPPRDKDRDRGPSLIALVVGLTLVAIGLYFFLDRTLGIAMPRVQWSSIWPVILIVIGGLVLIRSVSRRS